jgi:hypothetical protein
LHSLHTSAGTPAFWPVTVYGSGGAPFGLRPFGTGSMLAGTP